MANPRGGGGGGVYCISTLNRSCDAQFSEIFSSRINEINEEAQVYLKQTMFFARGFQPM